MSSRPNTSKHEEQTRRKNLEPNWLPIPLTPEQRAQVEEQAMEANLTCMEFCKRRLLKSLGVADAEPDTQNLSLLLTLGQRRELAERAIAAEKSTTEYCRTALLKELGIE